MTAARKFTFTPQQWDVWQQLYLDGLDAPRIAARLRLSDRTVDYHLENIRRQAERDTTHGVITALYDLVPKPHVELPGVQCGICEGRTQVRQVRMGVTSVWLCRRCDRRLNAVRDEANERIKAEADARSDFREET